MHWVLTTVEEMRAITVLPADKGGATALMDEGDYKTKALQRLSDTVTYTALTSDPTPKRLKVIQITLDEFVLEPILPASTVRTMPLKETSITRVCGLPKIRTTGNPLRIIVSLVGSPSLNCQNGF